MNPARILVAFALVFPLLLPVASAGPIFCSGTVSLNCGPGTGCDTNPVICVVDTVQSFVRDFKLCGMYGIDCITRAIEECAGLCLP